jgi:UDP-2,3-diacylglucosamine hydrolase
VTRRTIYFLSDLHIADPNEPRAHRLIQVLNEMGEDASTIYLLGDVFDFWLGYSSVVFKGFFPILRTFAQLIERGVEIVIFSGNHDPDPGGFLTDLGLQVEEHPKSIQIGEHSVWLEHGDIIDPRGRVGRILCKTVRNPAVRHLARLVHPDLAWKLSRLYARKTEAYTELLPRELLESFFPLKIREGHDVVVIGHYHRAVNHTVTLDGVSAQFYALGDWVAQFTYLRFDGEFKLLRDQGPDRAALQLPVGDHAPSLPQ